MLNRIQKAMLEAYEDGEYSYLIEEDAAGRVDAYNCDGLGDGLIEFFLREFADDPSGEPLDAEEADSRATTIQRQVDLLLGIVSEILEAKP